jgi:CheY-like chemotaxis protein
VVDDNAANRRILGQMLLQWRMRPFLAESGPQALEMIRERALGGEAFALAVLDAQMPGMDDFNPATRVQLERAFTGPRIMMLSSVDIRPASYESRTGYITEHLVKPVMRADLLKVILKVLGRPLQVPSASQWPVAARTTRPLHVLLAEDNLVNQKVGVRLLERLGHTVALVSNGAEALEAFGCNTFDVILMDIQMPAMDGYDATRAIRAREGCTAGHVPIIALTAHAMHGDRQICMDAGMDDYLSKPIQTRELCETLARWTDKAVRK